MEKDEGVVFLKASALLAHNIAASKRYICLDARSYSSSSSSSSLFPRPLASVTVSPLQDEESLRRLFAQEEKRVFFQHVVLLASEDQQHVLSLVQRAVHSYCSLHSCVAHGLARKVQLVLLTDVALWPAPLLVNDGDMDEDRQLFFLDRTILPHKISSDIYLGDWMSATDIQVLQHLNVKGVVNASNHYSCKFEDELKYLRVDVDDYPTESLVDHFGRALDFKSSAKGPVLVHCAQGVSRSAALVIALLMLEKGLTLQQSLTLVHSRRDIISPNQGFLEQLTQLEAQLRGTNGSEFVRIEDLLDYNDSSLSWENGLIAHVTTKDGKKISFE